MAKTFSKSEHEIIEMLNACKIFNYNGKKYDIKVLGKPASSSGEPKTDIYIYAECVDDENDQLEFKISFKQKNFEFLENKISADRAEEIFGNDWLQIVTASILNIKDKFEEKKLIYKKKFGKTEQGCFTLGWKFELLNVKSGNLSDEIQLSEEQLYDIFAGTNLDDDKRNAMVQGNRIPDSGIANYILIEDEYASVEEILSKIISMDDYVKEHDKLYFACKALNYRSIKKKFDGNRPLSVYVDWNIVNNKLSGKLVFNEPLLHGGNEICAKLIDCLNQLNIDTTDDVDDGNAEGDIIYE